MTTQELNALAPCPFCGGEAEIERRGDRRQSTIYQCTSCGCTLETGEEWGHGERWNTRAAASSQAGVETAPPSQEPVAWRRRRKGIAGTGGWIMCPEYPSRDKEFDLEPLYNTPPAQPAPAQQAVDVEAVVIPMRTAELVMGAFLPKNPSKMRNASREVIAAAHEYKRLVNFVLALINGGRDAGH